MSALNMPVEESFVPYGSHEYERKQGAWEEMAGRKGENDGDPVLI